MLYVVQILTHRHIESATSAHKIVI